MFRLINVQGRSALALEGEYHDLATLSGRDHFADPAVAVANSAALHDAAASASARTVTGALASVALGAPVPRPTQVFGIGLNYRDHASETGATLPPAPLTFTKFPTCIAGPTDDVPLSGSTVDWEVEIVAVIGTTASHVDVENAWSVVAGLTLGQDISDRTVQRTGTPPQFSLGKSFANYGPTGPALVSLDSFRDVNDVALWCEISGERMQESRTSQLIFSIPTLVAYLSSICVLQPGDLIFTGTPEGVGAARGRFLAPGDVIVSGAEGIGTLTNRCVAGRAPLATSTN